MGKFLKITGILFTVLVVIMMLFAAGTVIPAIPVFGSVANYVTVAFQHIWLPLSAAVFVIALLTAIFGKKHRAKHITDTVISFLTLISAAVTVLSMTSTLKRYVDRPNLFPKKQDVSQVVTDTKIYTVSDTGNVELNVYHLSDDKKNKPVMIFIHGGGWVFGSKTDHEYYSKVFAENGYVTFSVDYDISSKTRHLAKTTEKQILEAFAWVKKHAAEYGADAEDLYVTGGSAGGNLAIEIAFKINSGIYSTSSDGTRVPKVKAVSVTFPVADPADFYRNDDMILGGVARNMAYSYTGCSPEEDPELYRSITPVNFITKDAPAVNMLVGREDSLVPPKAAYELADAMVKAGVDCQLIIIPFGNHMFEMADGGMGCNAYLETSFKWFEAHR